MKSHRPLNKTINMKKDTPEIKSLSQYYKPKGYNQEQYVKYLNDYKTKVLLAVGPAGTGKTMFACNTAIRDLKSGSINKIVLTRPVVPVEEDIGFLPGNINKKMDPWTRPIFDTFLEFFSQKIQEQNLAKYVSCYFRNFRKNILIKFCEWVPRDQCYEYFSNAQG